MTYEEAEILKQSLNSDKYFSSSGNELLIFIAPANEQDLAVYKSALRRTWHNLKDTTWRQYTLKDDFFLLGIRQMANGSFAGGQLILDDHQELINQI